MQTAAATPSFTDFLREKVGQNWVLARRSPRIVRRYGDDVVCLSQRKFNALEAEYELTTLKAAHAGGPAKSLADAAPDLLEALREAQSFIAIMFSSGRDAAIPELVPTALGPSIKLGEIMRSVAAAISKAES